MKLKQKSCKLCKYYYYRIISDCAGFGNEIAHGADCTYPDNIKNNGRGYTYYERKPYGMYEWTHSERDKGLNDNDDCKWWARKYVKIGSTVYANPEYGEVV